MLDYCPIASDLDRPAIEACLAAGLIVIVEISDDLYRIAGMVSAHATRTSAFEAYSLVDDDNRFAVIIPQEAGPAIFYSWLTAAEFIAACRL